jgi:hypothetical protein
MVQLTPGHLVFCYEHHRQLALRAGLGTPNGKKVKANPGPIQIHADKIGRNLLNSFWSKEERLLGSLSETPQAPYQTLNPLIVHAVYYILLYMLL